MQLKSRHVLNINRVLDWNSCLLIGSDDWCAKKQNGNFRSSALFYKYYNIYIIVNIVSDLLSTIYNS